MSDTKIFATVKMEGQKFLALEHGSAGINLSIMKVVLGEVDEMKIFLDPDEAISLAEDLIRRAKLIKAELVKEEK